MSSLLPPSVLSTKSEMYAMISAIEADFIANLNCKLNISDVPPVLINRSNVIATETDRLLAILRGLDIQAYIEICNSNKIKLGINQSQRQFLNKELHEIIPIRNAVMHPRPLSFFDHPKLAAVFMNIESNLSCFTWQHVQATKIQISEHPETLIPPPELLKKSNRIIENLPSLLDYEETSFIGRKKEIAEIRAQLNRRNVSILSIIGDGGVGKTAITTKLLYEMLDDPQCSYELIIWTSLKTNELSDHDFSEIRNSIKTTSQMYEQLAAFIGTSSPDDTKEFLIELAQNFNTLFVLDNLETINSAEIKDFLDQFSEYGKILITSRIGLGEMEHRYKLQGLNNEEVIEYADVLLSLYGFECFFSDERKKQIFSNELHSNPLAIKWFIRCLYNGQTETEILSHKDAVINFCMENVYSNLSDNARNILDFLTVAGVELSFAELMYYMECQLSDCIKIKYAINELGKCNFISEETFRRENKVAVTNFAHEFLVLHFSDSRHLLARFKELEQKLFAVKQQLSISISNNPYDIHSIIFKDRSELVAALFLKQAITYNPSNKDRAFEIVRYAEELHPQYFECHLTQAHLYGPSSPLKAEEEYEKASSYAISSEEIFRTFILHSDFLIRCSDYLSALTLLKKAEDLSPNNYYIHLEKSKVYSCLAQFEDANHELDLIKPSEISPNQLNTVTAKRADILIREANRIDIRETQKRLGYLKQAFSELESVEAKQKIVIDYMAETLYRIVYLYMDNEAQDFILEKVKTHYPLVRTSSKYQQFIAIIKEKQTQINNPNFINNIRRYITDYDQYLDLLNDDEAYVYKIKNGYGFCKNSAYRAGIYFSMVGLPQDLSYGDILKFDSIFNTKNGPQAIRPHRIEQFDLRISQNTV